ncbi:MAG: D-Ala-D-Ala carboxypeptidase family metallohydrolase [archaeon]|nr:D-Ala-D-Ala carboxypeptidase family metallohydrolase [archaeon]
MVEKYSLKFNGTNNITKHFKVKEFASYQGNIVYSDNVLIDTLVTDILEKLFDYMSAYKIVITSGYRTSAHEKAVGNKSGTGYHVKGQAVDINVWKNSKTRYNSKDIAIALENLGWNRGIGIISETAVHVDSRDNLYWFDERYNCNSIKTIKGTNSWYDYFGVKKTDPELEKAISKLSSKKIIDKKFWTDNYNTELGKACIRDLLIKFSNYI